MVLLEAQAFGCPVVAGACGGVLSVVRDGDSGVLTRPGDANALAQAVMELCDDEDRRRALGSARSGSFVGSGHAAGRRSAALGLAAADRPTGRHMSMRVLIAVTHLLGAGHLTRAAAIARAFARAGHEVALVSGGTRTPPLVSTAGVQTVQLPPVRIVGTDFRSLLDEDGQLVGPEHLAARRRLLVDTLHDLRPDVVVTELFPFGRRSLADEFMELVTGARALRPRPGPRLDPRHSRGPRQRASG